MITSRRVKLYTKCRIATAVDADNQVTTWADYEEEDLHKPLPVSTGGSAGFYLDQSTMAYDSQYNVEPLKGREWNEIKLPIDYSEFTGIAGMGKMPRFVMMEVGMSDNATPPNTNSRVVYGWIDSAEPIATKGPKQNTLVRWHIDWWLTYADNSDRKILDPDLYADWDVAFGQGRIRRGPVELARPDPSQPRLWQYDSAMDLIEGNDTEGPYVIVLYTDTILNSTILRVAWWGVNMTSVDGQYDVIAFHSIYSGVLEELMNIASSQIVGVWFSPIRPHSIADSGVRHYQYSAQLDYGWYEFSAGSPDYHEVTITLQDPEMTDDQEKYLVIDPKGTVYATLPWGIEFDRVHITTDIGASGAWLDLDFKKGSGFTPGEGRRIQLPLLNAPITSNDWNEYVLSGQRDYDKQSARLQQETAAKSGIANMGTSVVAGAIGGAMAGGIPGAIGGAGGAAIGSTAGTAINFWVTEEYNAKAQRNTDTLMSNQTANVIVSGGGPIWETVYSGQWQVIKMVRDAVSAAELQTEQDELGYVTDTYSPDCDTFVRTGGPMMITGLQVRGDMSLEGKRYLRALFERGVNIDVITLTWS